MMIGEERVVQVAATPTKQKGTRMKLTFTSPAADDCDKSFINEGSLEERKAAFMKDEQLIREATKLVTEIIEQAKIEAARRAEQNAKSNGEATGTGNDKSTSKNDNTIAGWNNRARGFCNRVWNAVFPCFNNNEFLARMPPFPYRFSRP